MTEGTPRWVGFAVVILAAIAVIGLGVAWNATNHAKNAEAALAVQGKTIQQASDSLDQRLTQAEQSNADLHNQLMAVTDKLKMTQGQVTTERRQITKVDTEYSKKLDDVQTALSSKANSDDVNALGTDVNGVKTDLEAQKNNLQMTRGEFGTLIAKNHDEIDELRRLGERNYYEFTLSGKGQRAKVGGMTVELRDTNDKRKQFTLALYVDDMRLEKKNRAIDEPIYFYTRGTRAPLELVVNQVDKNKIVGYLSEPKNQVSASNASTSN